MGNIERLQEFDLLRSVATLTVIGIHVTAAYVYTSVWGCLANQFARFAVPLFIIMSGFLLFNADLHQHSFSTQGFYRKRFRKILWPYFIWSLFYCCLTGLMGADRLATLLRLPLQLIWGTAYYHLYFVVIVIQLYLLYPLLYRWLLRSPRLCMLAALILTFSCQTILNMQALGQLALPQQLNSFYLVFFPVWIFFFVFGMAAAMYKKSWQQFFKSRRFLLALTWLGSFGLLLLDSYKHNNFGSSMRPTVILYTLCSYFFFYSLALNYKGHLRKPINWIARQSFLIYLLHPFILTSLTVLASRMGKPDLWSRTRGMIVIYLLVTILSFGASYVISLTPLAEKLGGVRADPLFSGLGKESHL
jgi:surface polysaccharide O-acyltransferase-like enzyme